MAALPYTMCKTAIPVSSVQKAAMNGGRKRKTVKLNIWNANDANDDQISGWFKMKWRKFGGSLSLALLLMSAISLGVGVGQAANSIHLTLITHAAFFSSETHQPKAIDPQVFVRDSSAPAATGPQGIQHVAGVRPALIQRDAKDIPLLNATGERLGFDLAHWLAATGTVNIKPTASGKAEISAQFANLRPGGYYSLFENHFDQQPIGFTPLDGSGKNNNFVASKSGNARVNLTAPHMLTHANAVLLVYHSDRKFHGEQRGDVGVNAHHELIGRIPE
jgi:hypothetical protein